MLERASLPLTVLSLLRKDRVQEAQTLNGVVSMLFCCGYRNLAMLALICIQIQNVC